MPGPGEQNACARGRPRGDKRMSPAKRHPTGFVFTERALELDHEHRKRLRGGVPLTLSMRYLASALERLRKGTAPANAQPTPRPPDGTIAITFVGHATVMITTAS